MVLALLFRAFLPGVEMMNALEMIRKNKDSKHKHHAGVGFGILRSTVKWFVTMQLRLVLLRRCACCNIPPFAFLRLSHQCANSSSSDFADLCSQERQDP